MEPLAAIAVIVCAAVAPAAARGRYGHEHYWGFGRGLVGAVMGLVALPLVIASAVVSGVDEEEPPYRSEPYRGDPYRDDGYAPQAGYAPPPVYYAPRPAYYPAPQVYYAPNPNYHYRAPTYYPAPAAYRGPNSYYRGRSGYPPAYVGYAYPRR